MLFTYYHETALEHSITTHYRLHQFLAPEDLLDIERIAESFDVYLRFDKCKSVSDNQEKIIIIDNRLIVVQQRKIFFHELCHVLRHVGDQRKMHFLFKEGQETEADNFVLYAFMPFYMISQLEIPNRQEDAIRFLASTFKVPLKLAGKRLEQIQRRDLQGRMLADSVKQTETKRNTINVSHHNHGETRLYAYFDSTGDYIEPSQIIIQVDPQTLISEQEILFSPEGPFERLEESQLEAFVDSKPIKFNDLDYTRDGRISLKLSHLASRYYNSAFKFIVQRKDIEQVLDCYGADF
ncbi:hypothetical protein AWU65_07375 [Paenibacillus glucanolyticus]|uniref:IrrE N-terminal-like domain-containing protein n=2 Tax=Paenibacillus glucanolyticus TaxID=59843 RepID=A0A163I1D3_9BACL|nr:hypothetical protein AWU65_07375 [Paenibacillus glucanolyticus]